MGQGLWLQDCNLWSSSASKQFQKVGKLEGSVPCLSVCAKQVSSTAHDWNFIFQKLTFTINSRKLKHWKHLTHFVTEKTGAVHNPETAESAINETSNTAIVFCLIYSLIFSFLVLLCLTFILSVSWYLCSVRCSCEQSPLAERSSSSTLYCMYNFTGF